MDIAAFLALLLAVSTLLWRVVTDSKQDTRKERDDREDSILVKAALKISEHSAVCQAQMRDSLRRIHEKVEETNASIGDLSRDVALVKTELNGNLERRIAAAVNDAMREREART
ncbi:MAG: hypothetical protein C4523_09495 [Myxococcales bacterium]|nr:MAG: hypothetical protein C4523_09495 [Myxococcales bacterium]